MWRLEVEVEFFEMAGARTSDQYLIFQPYGAVAVALGDAFKVEMGHELRNHI